LNALGVVMKIWVILSIFIIAEFLVIGCQASSPTPSPALTYPDDLKIDYAWNTGSLPPKYHYSYEIVIHADGSGQFIYQQSYAGDGAPTPSVTAFTVSPNNIDQLYQLLLTRNMLRTEWAKKQPLIGGSSSEFEVHADGKTFSIPNDTTMVEQDKKDAAVVYEFIKDLVPKKIWDELAIKRNQVDSATDVPAQ
jgi:hypothetical protein